MTAPSMNAVTEHIASKEKATGLAVILVPKRRNAMFNSTMHAAHSTMAIQDLASIIPL